MRSISIGLLGLGNVGAGVVRILRDNRGDIEARLQASLQVKSIAVRDLQRTRQVEVEAAQLTTDPESIIADPDIRIVVEAMGGIEPAKSLVLAALEAGKHVVTANKALLAEHGAEIFECAAARNLSVFFEGSVAGGIPVLRALREGLASDRINEMAGIVNGTSNYVLDKMTRTGLDYGEAVRQAQEAGYAEADPSLDVGGHDATHKLALLAAVSFGVRVDPHEISTEGIEGVTPFDIEMARELGYVIKSLAVGRREGDDIELRVHPTLVPQTHILAGVHGAFNAVMVESVALGRSLYYGAGAGMMPTGMAVVSDIVEVSRNIVTFSEDSRPVSAPQMRAASPKDLSDSPSRNYLRVHVPNVPGVLGRVASCLGRHNVSIRKMNQDTPGYGEPIDMVVLTESVREADLRAAMAEIETFEDCLKPPYRIRLWEDAV